MERADVRKPPGKPSSPVSASPERCRVAIVGGGPAGCATAIRLARLGIDDVVVVEAGDPGGERVGESLPPSARRLLDDLGLLEPFLAEGHAPCFGSSSSWGSARLGHNDFLFDPDGHGWHLDRGRFDRFLAEHTRAAGASLRLHTRLAGAWSLGDGRTRLVLDGPDGHRHLDADFAVDATGHRSLLARTLGAEKRYLDRLICANAFFLLPRPETFRHVTLLEAVEYGWWYAARIPGGRVAVAVTSDPALLKARQLGREESWLQALAATRHLAPALREAGYQPDSLRAWPAHSFHLVPAVGEGWLAVGDAASTWDPISAQGIYKALGTGIAAGASIHRHLAGDAGAIPRYAALVEREVQRYAQQRDHLYSLEARWPGSPFWRQRRTAAA